MNQWNNSIINNPRLGSVPITPNAMHNLYFVNEIWVHKNEGMDMILNIID